MTTWTPTLLFIVPMIFIVVILNVWVFLKKRGNIKFPFADAVPRSPGESLVEKIKDLSFDLATYTLMSSAIPIFAYATYLQLGVVGPPPSLKMAAFLFFIAAFTTGWFIVKTIRTQHELHLYRIGYAGEAAVGSALNQLMLQGYQVFHDIQGDKKFNIDHLLVGPSGVFAVETKTKTKKKKINGKQAFKAVYDGKSLYFPDRPNQPHQSFLEQSMRNAKWVSKWLTEATGHPVKAQPVLVLPGWFIDIKKPGGVRVLNHNQVQALVSVPNKRPLDKAEIDRITYQVKQRCQSENIVPKVFTEQ